MKRFGQWEGKLFVSFVKGDNGLVVWINYKCTFRRPQTANHHPLTIPNPPVIFLSPTVSTMVSNIPSTREFLTCGHRTQEAQGNTKTCKFCDWQILCVRLAEHRDELPRAYSVEAARATALAKLADAKAEEVEVCSKWVWTGCTPIKDPDVEVPVCNIHGPLESANAGFRLLQDPWTETSCLVCKTGEKWAECDIFYRHTKEDSVHRWKERVRWGDQKLIEYLVRTDYEEFLNRLLIQWESCWGNLKDFDIVDPGQSEDHAPTRVLIDLFLTYQRRWDLSG